MKIASFFYNLTDKILTIQLDGKFNIITLSNLYESQKDIIILEKPPEGYTYQLVEDTRKECVKCNCATEYYTIAPYGSKYDGGIICAECIDK